MSLTIYAYIRFRKLRYRYVFDYNLTLGLALHVFYSEFSTEWWTWLVLTGVFMACTWGSKVNGILTVFAIGFAVLIDLWDILDVRKEGHTMVKMYPLCMANFLLTLYYKEYFGKHFIARTIGLIVIPFIIYLSFFYVHFAILNQSGPGDTFMSPAFQETLLGNEMLLNSKGS